MAAALFRMAGGSGMARGLAMGAVTGAVAAKVTAMQQSATNTKIAWEEKQWPHPNVGIVHFDLAELAEKRPAVLGIVRGLYHWWKLLLGVLVLNLIDSVVLTSTLSGSEYSALSIFFSFLCLATMGPLGFVAVFCWYHGDAEGSGRSKTIARVCLGLLLFLCFLFVWLPSGNINGIVGLAMTARIQAAVNAGSATAAVGYWQAVMVLESLAWGVTFGWGAYLVYRVMAGKAIGAPAATTPAAGTATPGAAVTITVSASTTASSGAGPGAGAAPRTTVTTTAKAWMDRVSKR